MILDIYFEVVNIRKDDSNSEKEVLMIFEDVKEKDEVSNIVVINNDKDDLCLVSIYLDNYNYIIIINDKDKIVNLFIYKVVKDYKLNIVMINITKDKEVNSLVYLIADNGMTKDLNVNNKQVVENTFEDVEII